MNLVALTIQYLYLRPSLFLFFLSLCPFRPSSSFACPRLRLRFLHGSVEAVEAPVGKVDFHVTEPFRDRYFIYPYYIII